MSSIPLMLEYVSGLGARPGDREAARAILAHEDYRFEQRRYEIPAAAQLIETTEKSYMIAKNVGYADPNYFSYVFKRKFGVSPSKYRREHTEGED